MLETYTTGELVAMEGTLARACLESNYLRHRDHSYLRYYLGWARMYRKVRLELSRRSSHK